MATAVAAPKSTGGGGFVFEDKVCAWFVAHMLANEPPFDPSWGPIAAMSFQAKPEGWLLDDLILELAGADCSHRAAFSIKSNVQFGVHTAPSEFVSDVWEQYLHESTLVFDAERDYMCLAHAPLPAELAEALVFVLSTAYATESSLLPHRYEVKGWANGTRRSLFKSFACPDGLARKHGQTPGDIGRVLARLRFIAFDFESSPSECEKISVDRCRRALRSGETDEGAKLWATLLQLSAKLRPVAGTLRRPELIAQIGHLFELKDLPNHTDDWARLLQLSSMAAERVHDVIGKSLRLTRNSEVDRLKGALSESLGVVLLGPSGAGKSAVAKALHLNMVARGRKCLWFHATSFERPDFSAFQAVLGLSHTLAELVQSIADAEAVLIIDGVDRLYDQAGFFLIGSLLDSLMVGTTHSPWRVLITSQTEEWQRLQRDLLTANIDTQNWGVVQFEAPSLTDLDCIWKAVPPVGRLRFQKNLEALMRNLKILDMLVTRAESAQDHPASKWVGESDAAIWYWQSFVATGGARLKRESVAKRIAQCQAESLLPAIRCTEIDGSLLETLRALEVDHVLTTLNGKVAFAHDLFGDWARLHVLIEHEDDLQSFITQHSGSPLWLRAIRLYGMYLLEHLRDVKRWRTMLASLADVGTEGVADLLLDSLIFAADPLPLLTTVCGDLMRDSGLLLGRLFTRFLAFGTLPDPRALELARALGLDHTGLAAGYRYPNWPYWPPMLSFIIQHEREFLPVAAGKLARISELWLDHTAPGFRFRQEVGRLGLLLGKWAMDARHDFRRSDSDDSLLCYRVALKAAGECPDEVAEFAREASERTVSERTDLPLSKAPRTRPRRAPVDPLLPSGFDSDEPSPEPWPDGPRSRIDENFKRAVLDHGAILPLVRVRPAAAREVVLASLISARRKYEGFEGRLGREALDLDDRRDWGLSFYSNGPFLGFLQINFEEGLETVGRLIDFATTRWRHRAEMEARARFQEKSSAGYSEDRFDRRLDAWSRPPGSVLLTLESGDRSLPGDGRVYGWSAGIGNPPRVVVCALMALEQYFYEAIDGGRPIGELLSKVLQRVGSTAFLKPLCDVGKRMPELFRGPLLPLLAVPELYFWEIETYSHGREHLMFGANRQGKVLSNAARKFHALPHRGIDIGDLAMRLFLLDSSVREYLSKVRETLEQRARSNEVGSESQAFAQFVQRFDIESYQSHILPDGRTELFNARARAADAEQAENRVRAERAMAVLFLPVRCRKMIDERTPLPVDQLDGFWQRLLELAESRSTTQIHGEAVQEGSQRVGFGDPEEEAEDSDNALAGGIAVIVRLHRDWLGQELTRVKWCVDQIRELVFRKRLHDPIDSPDTVSKWTWDCFVAEALPVLWAERPSDPELRSLTATLVFAYHYKAVEILFARLAEHRHALGNDFAALRRLLFEWAHVRNRRSFLCQFRSLGSLNGVGLRVWLRTFAASFRARRASSNRSPRRRPPNEGSRIRRRISFIVNHFPFSVLGRGGTIDRFFRIAANWRSRRIAAFVAGTISAPAENWGEMDPLGGFHEIDDLRDERYRSYFLDFSLVRAAHEWIPDLDGADDFREREAWLAFWKSSLSFSLARLKDEEDPSSQDDLPYSDDGWVLDRVAAATILMTKEQGAVVFWETLRQLPPGAHRWAERFLRSLHLGALCVDPSPPDFANLRTTIIESVLNSLVPGEFSTPWKYHEDVWMSLIGIDQLSAGRWQPRHKEIVIQNLSLLERWVLEHASRCGRHIAAFVSWLAYDAAEPARLPGIVWVAQVVPGREPPIWGIEDAQRPLALLLILIWAKHQAEVKQSTGTREAFQKLLGWLVARQVPEALELTRVVGML